MRKVSILAFTFILLFFSASLTTAQEERELKDTVSIEEIVVTGTKIGVTRNNVPFTISVVNRNEIEQSSESSLLQVLGENVPGLFVTERGITGFGVANGSAGQITIRGIGGNPNTQVLILLNGSPQFMGIMGHPLSDSYVASDVEKVEIIRGPASTLYGSNAMGGVINIITREQLLDGYDVSGRIMYGSYNTQKYMLNGGFRRKGLNVFASFNHDRTDGHRDSSDFKITNAYVKTGYRINKNFNTSFDFSLAKFKATDPGPESGYAGNTIDILRGLGSFSLEHRFDKYEGTARFFYNFGEHDITDGFHSKDHNWGVTVYESFRLLKSNTFTVGLDHKNFGGIAENVKAMQGAGMVFGDTTIYETGVYGLVQQYLFDRLTLNAGFRYEFNSVYGSEPIPSGGFAYRLTPTTTIKGSIAKGFRSPTIRELYLWAPANDDLKPERMTNIEGGIMQSLLENKLALELTIYRAYGDNLIKTIFQNNVPKNVNTGSFSNTGIEFSGKYNPNSMLCVSANYSYIDMREPMLATPVHQIFVTGTLIYKRLSVNVSMQDVIDLSIKTGDQNIKESYFLLNSKIGYEFNKYIDVFIKAENIFNQEYQINIDYPMPGITFFGGINLQL